MQSSKRRRRRRREPPLVTLALGPLAFCPLPPPPLQPRNDNAAAPCTTSATTPAVPSFITAAAGSVDEPAACPAVARLRCLVAAAEPELEARLRSTGETVDAAFHSRWLKARGDCPEAAAAGILAHVEWRCEFVGAAAADATAAAEPAAGALGGSPQLVFKPSDGIPEAAIGDELAARKAFLQGCDSQGCPVVVVLAARHDMGRRDLSQTKRLIAYVLDSACATADLGANPAGQICCLFDLAGLRPRNLDVKALLTIFELLQQHYPERLNSLYFLNAPFIFWGVWRLVSPFVHAATRQKIHFVAGRAAKEQLAARVPAQVLPAQYGGQAQLVPIDEAMAAWRQQHAPAAAAAAADAAAGDTASPSGGASGSRFARAAVLRRHAGNAMNSTRRFVHHTVVRPVGGAASGAAKALRHHHQKLLRRHQAEGTELVGLSEQEVQRSLLAVVVLHHVLLLLRMLTRVLRLATSSADAPASSPRSAEKADAVAAGSSALPAASQELSPLPSRDLSVLSPAEPVAQVDPACAVVVDAATGAHAAEL